MERDRDNALLSRGPRFRMDAEMVRANALAVSGLLSSKMYGPGTKPYQPEAIWDIVGLPLGSTGCCGNDDTGPPRVYRQMPHDRSRATPGPAGTVGATRPTIVQ